MLDKSTTFSATRNGQEGKREINGKRGSWVGTSIASWKFGGVPSKKIKNSSGGCSHGAKMDGAIVPHFRSTYLFLAQDICLFEAFHSEKFACSLHANKSDLTRETQTIFDF